MKQNLKTTFIPKKVTIFTMTQTYTLRKNMLNMKNI